MLGFNNDDVDDDGDGDVLDNDYDDADGDDDDGNDDNDNDDDNDDESTSGVKYASLLSIRACLALIQSHKLELRTTNREHESFDSHFLYHF